MESTRRVSPRPGRPGPALQRLRPGRRRPDPAERRPPSRAFPQTYIGAWAAALLLSFILAAPTARAAAGPEPAARAREILALSGVKGGLVVHLGCGDGRLTAALRASESYLVHGLDADTAQVAAARKHLRALGVHGSVSVERWAGTRLPYIDNTVNLFVAEDLRGLPMAEVTRVLAPGGVACRREAGQWVKTTKPRPADLDDWPHALYDAGNNAVARDTAVGPPHHLQWVAEPKNARHHESLASVSVVVSAGGRLFTIGDEAPTASILLPPRWMLVARDAFNGVVLWKRAISRWEPHTRSFRSGPPELSRRLVATAERVYVTLGLGAPVTALDPATGETLTTYTGTENAEEILLQGNTLFLVTDAGKAGAAPARGILAVDAVGNRVLWRAPEADPLPVAVAIDGGRLAYLNRQALVCVDARSGSEIWRAPRPTAEKRPGWSAATLVMQEGVVLCSDRDPNKAIDTSHGVTDGQVARWLAEGSSAGILSAHDAATGKVLWSCPAAEAYHSPTDVFVIDGLVWVGQSRARTGPDFREARDLRTGEVKRRIKPDKAFETTMPHHRCHRNRATTRYLVTGRTGVEFIDVESGDAFRHHWTRGTCQFGVLPCNGLLYSPPHSCACYIEGKLTGFLAMAPRGKERLPTVAGDTVEKGPGYGETGRRGDGETGGAGDGATGSDWPTYRHDPARTGRSQAKVPSRLKVLWEASVGGRITAPVVAGGRALVASIDRHTLHALDAATGKQVWEYTAGGRIDSPPTVAKGLVVLGCADGWVHCVRLADGALAWRSRVAPAERRLVAFGQLESAWPASGSVLVRGDVVTCVAGRSSYLDGGLFLCRLDLKTGRKLGQEQVYLRDPATGEQPDEPMMFEMAGALPDVLSCDGRMVYMRHLAFDPETLKPQKAPAHLYSPAGFLNDDWWHRTYWIYGNHFYSGYIGWYFAGRETPAGRILSLDGDSLYGFSYRPDFYRGAAERKYHLFAMNRKEVEPQPAADYQRANKDYPASGPGIFRMKFRWSREVPLLGQAMVVAGDTLFTAGLPSTALRSLRTFEGRKGAVFTAVSAADGETLATYHLNAVPVFDGMAAAGGRLYLSLQDGRLICLGEGDAPEGGGTFTKVAPTGTRAPGKPLEAGFVGHWKLDEGEDAVAADSSGVGTELEISGQWAKGDFGACIATGGLPGAITVPDGPHLHFGADPFSLALWVKPDALDCRLMGKEKFPDNWWVINVLPDGRPELVLGERQAEGKMVRPTAKARLATEKWAHLAFVVDRPRKEVRWYVDGALDSRTPIPAQLTGSLSVEGRDLAIPSSYKPYRGLVDELRIYTRALTEAEVRAIHDREKAGRETAAHQLAP